MPDGGTWLIAGSYFGGPQMPLWAANLRAAETAEVSVDGRRTTVTRQELTGAARAEAWQVMLRTWPNFAVYEERTDRTIPVFRLTPFEAAGTTPVRAAAVPDSRRPLRPGGVSP